MNATNRLNAIPLYAQSPWAYLIWLAFILGFTNCNTTKYLQPGEKLITKSNVQILSETEVEKKPTLKYNLSTLIPEQQRPNNKFFGLFRTRLWFYYKNQDPSDTTNFKEWQKRVLAEPPSLYNAAGSNQIAGNMINYLQKKGYWDAQVIVDSVLEAQRARLTYVVNPGKRYRFTHIDFVSSDTNIHQFLQEIKTESFLTPGAPIDRTLFNQEIQRVTSQLRDEGYAFFFPSYVDQLELDTTNNQINATFRILPPTEADTHAVYRIGNVRVFPNFNSGLVQYPYRQTFKGLNIYTTDGKLGIRPGTLKKRVFLEEQTILRYSDLDKTRRLLGDLEIYFTPLISQRIDSLNPNLINLDIRLSPKKKWELGYDIELSTSSGVQSNSLIGVSANLTVNNRNLLNGGEYLTTNLALGAELPSSLGNQVTLDNRINFDISIPSFYDPFRFYRGLRNIGILSPKAYDRLIENTDSKISLSYQFIKLIDFYEFNQFNTSFGYDIRPDNFNTIILNHIGIDYLRSSTESMFDAILANNPFLQKSFATQQLFTGFLLRDINYYWNNGATSTNNQFYFNGGLEVSGLEVFLAERVYNAIANRSESFQISGIPFAKFVTLQLDGRYYKRNTDGSELALRLATAIGVPYGESEELPYVKQFFVGGPTSIRAWRIRQLGPGGYFDPNHACDISNRDSLTNYFQTGDFKLEFNAEYRFDLFWRFDGAVFLDGGNVWTLRRDTVREGSQLLLRRTFDENGDLVGDSFLRQIALGTGLGLRVDFTYFIVRLDAGIPLRYPYPATKLQECPDCRRHRVNYNLAIGFPF